MNEVVIFGTPNCSYCQMAKKLCENFSVPFVYYDISSDTKAMNYLMDTIGVFKTVPQIFVDEEHIGGFEELKGKLND
jgi:glutaredoxin